MANLNSANWFSGEAGAANTAAHSATAPGGGGGGGHQSSIADVLELLSGPHTQNLPQSCTILSSSSDEDEDERGEQHSSRYGSGVGQF